MLKGEVIIQGDFLEVSESDSVFRDEIETEEKLSNGSSAGWVPIVIGNETLGPLQYLDIWNWTIFHITRPGFLSSRTHLHLNQNLISNFNDFVLHRWIRLRYHKVHNEIFELASANFPVHQQSVHYIPIG